jgi:large subunit ribosomal protein L35e
VRKDIARLLTAINEKTRAGIREEFANKKYKPITIREKKTRAIRRALSKEDAERVPLCVKKRQMNFPQRNFTLAK